MFNFFKRKKDDVDLTFSDMTNLYYHNYPVLTASEYLLKQRTKKINDGGNDNLHKCPGMHDFARMGYVITTPVDVYLKANKAGSWVEIGPPNPQNKRDNNLLFDANQQIVECIKDIVPTPRAKRFISMSTMDVDIADPPFDYEDDIDPNVWKYNMNWSITTKNKNLGCYIYPAFYHNPELMKRVYTYPGVVDYGENFQTINWVFSIKKRCEYVIREGEAIVHVIPYTIDKEINATCGPSNFNMKVRQGIIKNSSYPHFYRKKYMKKKKYNIKTHTIKDE